MSFNLLQDCIDMDVAMSASTHAVLVVLCRHANDAGECFPSTALIAKKAHLNPRTVMQAVRELEEGAWISCAQAPGKKRRFTLDVAKIKALVTPAENCTPAKSGTPVLSCTPAENCTPVKSCTPAGNNSEPLQETAVDPCRKLQTNKKVISKEEVSSCAPSSSEAVTPPDDFTFIANDEYDAQGYLIQPEPAEAAKADKPKKKEKAAPHAFSLISLPDDWRSVADELCPGINVDETFSKFRVYWTFGTGSNIRRGDTGWRQSWLNWLKNEAKRGYKSELPPVSTNAPVIDGEEFFNELRRKRLGR